MILFQIYINLLQQISNKNIIQISMPSIIQSQQPLPRTPYFIFPSAGTEFSFIPYYLRLHISFTLIDAKPQTHMFVSLKSEQFQQQIYAVFIDLQTTMTSKYKIIKRNTKNYFVMQGRKDLYFKQEVSVTFKPFPKSKKRRNVSILPTFNNDRKYFTCAFSLPSSPIEEDREMQQDHQNRVAESLKEIEEIFVPKPRSKNKYCGVCRDYYQDYLEHTEGVSHINLLRKSIYQMLIVDCCKVQRKKRQKFDNRCVDESKIIDLTCQEESIKNMESKSTIFS